MMASPPNTRKTSTLGHIGMTVALMIISQRVRTRSRWSKAMSASRKTDREVNGFI
jgi:hypothetical protein